MSVCTFIAANCPMDEVRPPKEYPLEINIDTGAVFDGDADDNFFLYHFRFVSDYTDKAYGVSLEWSYFTEGRAKQVLKYIGSVLQHTDSVEVWIVWQNGGYYEYDERPIIRKKTLHLDEVVPEDIRALNDAEVWDDKFNRPVWSCLEILK